MSARFTDDDLEKTVENPNGETIGTITAVEGDVAQVEPEAGVMNSIRTAIGWTRARDTVSIRPDAVDEITDDAVRLEMESLAADEAEGPAADDSGPTELADAEDEPDETAPGAGLEADEPATRSAEPDPETLEEADREASPEATDVSGETDATAEELEAELDRGAKVEPPSEREVRETVDESTETAGGETAEMTDVPEELEPGEERDEAPEPDSSAEEPAAERDESDELDRSENSGDAEAMDVVDEPRGGETFEAGERAADVEPVEREDEESGAGDADRETEEMDLADELERGPDLESVDDAGDASEPSTEDVGDELTRGTDFESAAESTDESPEPETEEMDLAGELDRGADLDAVEEDASPETPDPGVREEPTEEMDLAEELDRGVDVESAAEADREADADRDDAPADADAFPGPKADSEIAADAVAPRSTEPASHAELETEPALDHRTDEPATTEADTDEVDQNRPKRGGSELPVGAVIEAQRTAIEQSQRLFEDSLAVQRNVNRIAMNTLRGQMALQRQGFELVQSMTPDPSEAAEAIGAPADEQQQSAESAARSRSETGTLQRQSDDSESTGREREFEGRLELIDGLDSMYRKRLEDAGIATLDDLAYADIATVAEAADVTEQRAESWIEQASA